MLKSIKDFFGYIFSEAFLRSFRGKIAICLVIAAINIFWVYVAKTAHNPYGNKIYFTSGAELEKDIYSAEYLIEHDTFYFGKNFRGEDDYTYRMPGHLFLYLPFRLFFSIEGTIFAEVIFNLILSIIASYLLACIVLNLTRKPLYFWLTLLLFLGSGYVQHFNFGAGRESTTTYVLIIAFYLYQRWQEDKKTYRLVVFSLLLTWCILYRPFLGPPVYVVFAIIIFQQWKLLRKLPLKLTTILFLPSFIFFSYWIPRNYILTGEFIPLETVYLGYAKSYRAIPKLINTWAGESLPWVKNSEAAWFNDPRWSNDTVPDEVLPYFLFNDTLTIDSLKLARDYYWKAHDLKTFSNGERIAFDNKATEIIDKFILYQKNKFPFRSYIGSNIILLSRFIYQPIGIPTRNIKYPLNVVLTFTTSFFNLFIFLFGFLSAFCLLFYSPKELLISFSIILTFYMLIFFPLIFDIELRRIAHAIPILIINSLYMSKLLFEYYKNRIFNRIIIISIIFIISALSIFTCAGYIQW